MDQRAALEWVQQHVCYATYILVRRSADYYPRFIHLVETLRKLQFGACQPVRHILIPSLSKLINFTEGADSVMQHMIADGGDTQPPLFRAGISSSLFMPPQFKFDDPIPEVGVLEIWPLKNVSDDMFIENLP